jgi:hypothetical protein
MPCSICKQRGHNRRTCSFSSKHPLRECAFDGDESFCEQAQDISIDHASFTFSELLMDKDKEEQEEEVGKDRKTSIIEFLSEKDDKVSLISVLFEKFLVVTDSKCRKDPIKP